MNVEQSPTTTKAPHSVQKYMNVILFLIYNTHVFSCRFTLATSHRSQHRSFIMRKKERGLTTEEEGSLKYYFNKIKDIHASP